MSKNNHAQKTALTAFIIVLLIFISGCSQTGTVEKFRVGTQGLVVEFPTSNPKGIYEGEEFGTLLYVKNVGAYNVNDSSNPITLKTTYDDYRVQFSGTSTNIETQTFLLNGKSKEYPAGDETSLEFYFKSKMLTELRESSTTSINYNLCYPYTTELTTMTCMDTKTVNRADIAAACTSETYNGGAGQGAPIVITKIEPEILLQTSYIRPQFKIYIENKGDGYVTDALRCIDTNINDRNSSGRVSIQAWLSDKKMECGPLNSGSLRLVDSESFIRCYLPNTDQTYSRTKRNYITPLTVKISYTYTDIKEQKIDIKRDDTLQHKQPLTCNSYEIQTPDNSCVDRCSYCATNPTATECNDGKPSGFEFKEGFECACDLAQCDAKLNKSNCIKGNYCAGTMYCCSTVQCDAYQIAYKGECMDKCTYCATNPTDTKICSSTLNLAGFSCESMTGAECDSYAKNKSCIRGYCGGNNIDKYCANMDKINAIKSASSQPTTTTSTSTAYTNTCDYCAKTSSSESKCLFNNGVTSAYIGPGFSCSCNLQDKGTITVYSFVPDQKYCDNGLYCCKKTA